MTKAEFLVDYTRLCQRFRLEPHEEQARVWFQRFGHEPLAVWKQAVDHLVAEMRPPLLDHVLRALDRAQEDHRHTRLARERREIAQAWGGDPVPDEYCIRRALRRFVQGERPLEAILDEEYATDLRAGKLDASDKAAYARYKIAMAEHEAARKPVEVRS